MEGTAPSSCSHPSREVTAGRGIDVAVLRALKVSVGPEGAGTGQRQESLPLPRPHNKRSSERPPLVPFARPYDWQPPLPLYSGPGGPRGLFSFSLEVRSWRQVSPGLWGFFPGAQLRDLGGGLVALLLHSISKRIPPFSRPERCPLDHTVSMQM